MKFKTIVALFTGALLSVSGVGLSACGENLDGEDEHVHTAGEVVVENEVEATCSTDGSYDSVVYCTVCGEEISRETVTVSSTNAHTAGEAVVENEVEATCSTDGSYDSVVYCTVCGEEISRETVTLSATNAHTYNGSWTCTACGSQIVESEGLNYTLSDNGESYIVSGIGTCTDSDVVIPYTYNELPVTAVGGWAFYDDNIITISLPGTITELGVGAFAECGNLTSITVNTDNITYKSIDGVLYSYDGTSLLQYPAGKSESSFSVPDGVTEIGDLAFVYLSSLTNITLPEGLTTIGYYAFAESYLLESVNLPDSLTTLGEGAFSCCEKLQNITIPENVTEIGDCTFEYCESLTEIYLHKGIAMIGDQVFDGCISLADIEVDSANTAYKSVNGNLYTYDGTIFMQYALAKTETSFTIPSTVTLIRSYAFYGCTSLASVTFENTTGWYVSSNSWSYTDGTSIDVTDPEANATTLKSGSGLFIM